MEKKQKDSLGAEKNRAKEKSKTLEYLVLDSSGIGKSIIEFQEFAASKQKSEIIFLDNRVEYKSASLTKEQSDISHPLDIIQETMVAIGYDRFKQDLLREFQKIVKTEHEQTREVILRCQQLTEKEIIEAIKSSPVSFVKLFSKIGLITFLFFLLTYILFDVYFINPYFSFFGIIACTCYLTMAYYTEKLAKKGS